MLPRSPRESGADALAVRLRTTGPGDLAALFEMQSDPESNEMAGTKPRTREVFFAAWEGHFANPELNSKVIEIDGEGGAEIVGSVACFQIEEGGRRQDCVGYWIARGHWGKGIASRALAMFLKEERRRPLHATADRANLASRRILEKCGFRCVGFHVGEETERFLAREVADFVLG
jgi:RimJ/RimL family protein N-acetyltransferase